MCLFSLFRSKKNVILRGDISNHLVYVYKLKNHQIWFNTKLSVPDDFGFVIGKNGKVLDCFEKGEYDLKAIYLPISVKKFHLDRQQKDGSYLTSFLADAYFVNLNTFKYEKWKTFRKIEMFDENYGYYNFSLQGGFAFKVIDAKKFMTALLKVYDYLKNGEAINLLQGFISQSVVKFFDKIKFTYKEISNIDFLTDKLFEVLSNDFEKMGIDIEGFIIEKIKFSHGYEKYLKNIDLEKEFANNIKTNETNDINTKKPELKNVNFVDYSNSKKEQVKYFSTENKFEQEDEIVDLEKVSLYNNETQTIRCKFCGAKNSQQDKVCHLCGEILIKR